MDSPEQSNLTDGFAERFEVSRELGRGGMAVVMLAHDRKLDRPVALKLLAPEISAAVGADRFIREIRVTARLVHPNIVPLFDSGKAGSRLFYVMPYIAGPTLRAHLGRFGPRPIDETVRILCDIAEALAYAHTMGIVHRDLKPENIFWSSDRALLADFGIASVTAPNATSMTADGLIIGTLAYMSPEQASGIVVDGRSDLYSLGCVAYELLTGSPPFQREAPAAIIAAHLTANAPPIRHQRADIPESLAQAVERLLAKSPADRPSSAASLLDQLRTTGGALGADLGELPTWAGSRESPEVADLIAKATTLYFKGAHGGEGTRTSLEMARVYAERAVAKAPESPRALIALADTVHISGLRGFIDSAAAFARAKELRMQALAIDDNVGEVHASLGYYLLYWEDDFESAGIELARAVELAPKHAEGRRQYGNWLKMAGRPEESLREMQAAAQMFPQAPYFLLGVADLLMTLGRYDEAIKPLRESLRQAPKYESVLERLEMSCHRAGRHEEALEVRSTWLGLRGLHDRKAMLEEEVRRDGWLIARERDLRRDLEAALTRATAEDPFVDVKYTRQLSDRIIVLLAELGEWTQAMDWVDRGYMIRPGRLRRVLTDMPFNRHGLESDPRYARLLRTAGLTELLG
jgi:tetratricopeptide (TPR) repeat protein